MRVPLYDCESQDVTLEFVNNYTCNSRDECVLSAYNSSLQVYGQQMHILCKPL